MKTSTSGCPPPDHPRRCQAKSRRRQSRCQRWALKGSKYCQFHGGRRTESRGTNIPRIYSKYLGKTLKEELEAFLGQSHHQQVSVYEELAISRVAAAQALRLAEPVLTNDIKLKPETVALALSCLRDAMNNVRDMVVAAAKIEALATDKISIRYLDTFLTQIIRAIYIACGDEDGIAEVIEQEIRENVRLPIVSDLGTDSTPSTVLEMDESIVGKTDSG